MRECTGQTHQNGGEDQLRCAVEIGLLFAGFVGIKLTAILPLSLVGMCLMLYGRTWRARAEILVVAGFVCVVSVVAIWYFQYLSLSVAVEALNTNWASIRHLISPQGSIGTPMADLFFRFIGPYDTASLDPQLVGSGEPPSIATLGERVLFFVPIIGCAYCAVRSSRGSWKIAALFVLPSAAYYLALQRQWTPSTYFEFLSFSTCFLCVVILRFDRLVLKRQMELASRRVQARGLAAVAAAWMFFVFVSTTYGYVSLLDGSSGTGFARNSWAVYRDLTDLTQRHLYLFKHDAYMPLIENVMIGMDVLLAPGRADSRRHFAVGRSDFLERAPILGRFDALAYSGVVFFYKGTLSDYEARADAIWSEVQNEFAAMDLIEFTQHQAFEVRRGPWVYDGPGVYVFYFRPASITLIAASSATTQRLAVAPPGLRVRFDPAGAGARDAQRKDDLRRLGAALEAYHQAYGRYPCASGDAWLWSTNGADWLRDDGGGCNAPISFDLAPKFMSQLPADAINAADPRSATGAFWEPEGYVYGYRGSLDRCPANKKGQYYVIGARLENEDDQDGELKVAECDGSPLSWPDGVFALTSEEQR